MVFHVANSLYVIKALVLDYKGFAGVFCMASCIIVIDK